MNLTKQADIFASAGLIFNPMAVFETVYSYDTTYYILNGCHTSDNCDDAITGFAGHSYRTVNQFILAYFAPVIECARSGKESSAIYEKFRSTFTGITELLKQSNVIKNIPNIIIKTMGLNSMYNMRHLNSPYLLNKIGIPYRSYFSINSIRTITGLNQLYSDKASRSIILMPVVNHTDVPADKIVAQEISDRSLMTVFTLKGLLSVMSTNVNVISTSIIFMEYIKSWYNEKNKDTDNIRNYVESICTANSIGPKMPHKLHIPIIAGIDKFSPEDLIASRRLLMQRYPIAGILNNANEKSLVNVNFEINGYKDNEIQALYSESDDGNIYTTVSSIFPDFYKEFQSLLAVLRSSAMNSFAFRTLLQLDILSSIIYKISANVSIKEYDIEFIKPA